MTDPTPQFNVPRLHEPRLEPHDAHHRALLESLLEAVNEAVIAMDSDGRITYWNNCARDLYGWSAEEVLGRNIRDDIVPPESAEQEAQIVRALGRGRTWSGDFTIRRKDRSTVVAYVTNAPLRAPDGTLRGYVGVARDVTERRHLEEQLRQSQKMEAVGRLAGGIAHDFNNLLTVIKAHAELGLESAESDQPLRGDLEEIRKAATRAAALTGQLLAYSRKQLLQPRVVCPNDVIVGLHPMLARLIGEDIHIETRLHPDVGDVMADPGQLEQVLVNLVVNARDAVPLGGVITIEATNVALDEAYASHGRDAVVPGDYVMLAVTDTGVGIPRDSFEMIFEPFFTTKPPGQGTGLGLSTVYGIVKQSGGHVWVYSEPGIGTTFKVYLPRLPKRSQVVAETRPAVAAPGGRETVLLVEDEAEVSAVVKRILTRHGYTVLEASGGAEALELATRYGGPIHLVLTDVVMPSITGPALIERLREIRPGLAALYTSGYTDDDIVRRGVLTTSMRFIQKPFTSSDLATAVRDALDAGFAPSFPPLAITHRHTARSE